MRRTRFAFKWRGSTYDLKSLCFYPTTWLRVRHFWRSHATGFCGAYCPAFLPVIFKAAHFPPQRSSPAPSIPFVLGIQIFLTLKQPQFRHFNWSSTSSHDLVDTMGNICQNCGGKGIKGGCPNCGKWGAPNRSKLSTEPSYLETFYLESDLRPSVAFLGIRFHFQIPTNPNIFLHCLDNFFYVSIFQL